MNAKEELTAVTFSVAKSVKEDIDRRSIKEGRSKSDLFRDMYNYYKFKQSLYELQLEGQVIGARLGLENEDDVIRYLNED
jgi:Ribbon-helix-helix protein, copG family